jgi:DNA polymerase-3 subunit delta'
MPFSRKAEQALGHFRQAAAADRFPHAILVAGHPRREGLAFAEALLGLLFPGKSAAQLHEHVDVQFIEPESKSRQIRVETQIRPLISFIGTTSYEGGWKAGVILFADRMNASAQNALLKTLEEPPEKTALVLVTDIPGAMLATVRSRSYYVDLQQEGGTEAPWRAAVLELLANPPERRPLEIQAWADRLAEPLAEVAAQAEEEEEAEARASLAEDPNQAGVEKETMAARVAARIQEEQDEIFRVVQLWQRDLAAVQLGGAPVVADRTAAAVQAGRLTPAQVLRRIQAVEEARERVRHNLQPGAVLFLLARELSMPRGV